LFVDPSIPEEIVHPVFGVISQTSFPSVQGPFPAVGTMALAIPVLVKVTALFTQTVSLGEIEKSALGFFEIRIPPIVPGVSPHGFEMV
jgi:hypothetical protein